jgi:uncharacterized protein (DUF433 family)
MGRDDVAIRVREYKCRLAEDQESVSVVRSDGRAILEDDAQMDGWTGQQVFDEVARYLDVFDLKAPLDVNEFKDSRLWGPNLVKPSKWTSMSPWIMGGDPCIDKTRIPTIGLYALRRERGLTNGAIADFYGVDEMVVSDALVLEERLHEAA